LALSGVLLLLPGVIAVRSSHKTASEPVPSGARMGSVVSGTYQRRVDPATLSEPSEISQKLPSDPRPIRAERVDRGLASLAPAAVEGGDALPFAEATHEDVAAASELRMIEASTTAEGHSLIELLADGSISNAAVSELTDPQRLVIDLPGMVSVMESSRLAVDSDRVRRVRVGRHDEMVRVVLDAGRKGAESFDGWQLVPAHDGLRVTLGASRDVDAPSDKEASVQSAALRAPVASLAPPDRPAPVALERADPARQGSRVPFYLLSSGAGERLSASGPPLEESYDCIIEPSEVVEVGSALTAVIASVGVERSDYVEAGQVLARLEASTEQASAEVARARARMNGDLRAREARMELGWRKRKRADQLFEQKALSADLRDEILTEAQVADAVVQEARERKALMALEYQEALERLEEHTIRSPVSGVVVDRLKSPGEVVKEETIVVLAQIDPLRVEVVLPAADFGAIRPGMRAEVVPEIPNAGVQVATVTVVDRVVDGTSGTFGVRLELPNTDHAVPSGLRCQVRFLQID
jgi:RND family efflux transporter MFP subunit